MKTEKQKSNSIHELLSDNRRVSHVLRSGENLEIESSGFARFQTSQSPKVAILACADSRVAPEVIFAKGIGDLFVVRSAGYLADDYARASLEFAVAVLGVEALMVLGHSSCGAVQAAIQGVGQADKPAPGQNLKKLLEDIRQSIPHCTDSDVDHAVEEQAKASLQQLIEKSKVIQDHWQQGKLELYSAVYQLSTGEVEIIDEQRKVKAS